MPVPHVGGQEKTRMGISAAIATEREKQAKG